MTTLEVKQRINTWITASWEDYIQETENSQYEKLKFYYYNGQLRIEMSPVGPDHSDDNCTMTLLINLFGMAKGIAIRQKINCSYRQPGIRECQPDISC